MAWRWSYEGPDGAAAPSVDLEQPDFPTQADAESWVGETWRELREAGVHAVSLEEDGRHVYGPMGLDPA
ncbi:MAG: hypothetical protein JWN31_1317 [Frankiales bacterium]|nr:hypothetical protein [Frankiales bacterium]